ncbi:hypothetical protein EGM51_13445 [Verrucomicrobia bacterium S94]|nr:hypothetical protein EGM51_13445 [Verrucomicrobia bacterium S94]
MKKIAMLLVTAGTIGMLSGCGIPEEEHNMIIEDLKTQHQEEVDKLKGEIEEQKELVSNEKKKVRQGRIELDDATERIQDLQQKSAQTSKELAAEKSKVSKLESELKITKAKLTAAEERATEAETALNTLDVEHQELKRRFEMFKKNMSSISTAPASAPVAVEAAPVVEAAPASAPAPAAPKTDAEKASSLLEQMGTL